mgnify:FL=1
MDGIFSDVIVLELAGVLAGPSVGQFFAELGARVIKLENTTTNGDVTRTWKMPGEEGDQLSSYFHACNWGKESIAVNLVSVEGQAIFSELVAKTDVVISNYVPRVAKSLNADYASLKAIKPDIICGSIVGYAPDSNRPGYDAIIQAESGYYHINGTPKSEGGAPTKMPVALMDILAGHQLKQAILIALYNKLKTGKGASVTVSLFDAAVSAMANQATNWLVAGIIPDRIGSEHPNIAPYGSVYEAQEGQQLVLGVGTDRQFAQLCAVLGLDEVAHDIRFKTNTDRVQNRHTLNDVLGKAIASFNRASLLKTLNNKGVPSGAVHAMDEVFDVTPEHVVLRNEEGQAQGVSECIVWPNEENSFMKGTSSKLSPPPSFAKHTRTVLKTMLGYSDDQITEWTDLEVIK